MPTCRPANVPKPAWGPHLGRFAWAALHACVEPPGAAAARWPTAAPVPVGASAGGGRHSGSAEGPTSLQLCELKRVRGRRPTRRTRPCSAAPPRVRQPRRRPRGRRRRGCSSRRGRPAGASQRRRTRADRPSRPFRHLAQPRVDAAMGARASGRPGSAAPLLLALLLCAACTGAGASGTSHAATTVPATNGTGYCSVAPAFDVQETSSQMFIDIAGAWQGQPAAIYGATTAARASAAPPSRAPLFEAGVAPNASAFELASAGKPCCPGEAKSLTCPVHRAFALRSHHARLPLRGHLVSGCRSADSHRRDHRRYGLARATRRLKPARARAVRSCRCGH